MRTFSESLTQHALKKIINIKKKKMKLLTNEQQDSYESAKAYCIWKKKMKINIWRIKKYRKVTDDCHYTGEYRDYAHSTFNLNYSVLKKNFYRCSYVHNYGYHFIIKELAKEFEKQFSCLGKDTEKYIAFCTMLLMSGFMIILLAGNWFEDTLFPPIIIIA